jgi:hypothetical protein
MKITRVDEGDECNFPKAKATNVLNDKFCRKIRPRIVFDLTIHRENFYRVDLINLTFHFDINFFAEKPLVVFSLSGLFFHSTRCFFTINQFDWSKFEKCCNSIG